MEGLQNRLQTELEKFKAVQKDLKKSVSARQLLEGQLNENTLVKEELDILESDAVVYKMMGPVLVKQDVQEAKSTVQKRIDYISGELKRHESAITELEKEQDTHRESVAKIQQQFQQAQVKAAAKA